MDVHIVLHDLNQPLVLDFWLLLLSFVWRNADGWREHLGLRIPAFVELPGGSGLFQALADGARGLVRFPGGVVLGFSCHGCRFVLNMLKMAICNALERHSLCKLLCFSGLFAGTRRSPCTPSLSLTGGKSPSESGNVPSMLCKAQPS